MKNTSNENEMEQHFQAMLDQVVMRPMPLASRTNISRKMLLQTSAAIEKIVRDDMQRRIALGLDQSNTREGSQ